MHVMRIVEGKSRSDTISSPATDCATSVITATLLAFDVDGGIRVALPGDQTVPALSAISLSENDIGRRVMLAIGLRPGDPPVITGRCEAKPGSPVIRTKVDGDRVVIQAEREIELRCGDASIVLTRAGKILLRGNFVLSHSRGMHRIRGASVHIN
jgi:hypothetical protein